MLNTTLTKEITINEGIDIKSIQSDKINLITAPTSAGKTYAAINKIATLLKDGQKMLYLIDTTASKENIIATYKEIREYGNSGIEAYDKHAVEQFKKEQSEKADHIKSFAEIMTYAKFGVLVKFGLIDFHSYGVIICDEMHALIKFRMWERGKLKKSFPFAEDEPADSFLSSCSLPYIAYNTICEKAIGHDPIVENDDTEVVEASHEDMANPYVVVMSATPSLIRESVKDFNEVHINGNLRTLKEKKRKYYVTSNEIPLLLSKTGRTVIYLSQIEHMIKLESKIKNCGKSCISIWSLTPRKKEAKMNEEQLKVRRQLLDNGEIPKEYDVLIINDAYQTCLNIEPKEVPATVDTVIVNTSHADTIIQARGRVRHNIDALYILDMKNTEAIIYRDVPDKFLNKPLLKKDRDELSRYFGIRDDKSQLKKWPYIKAKLDKNVQNRPSWRCNMEIKVRKFNSHYFPSDSGADSVINIASAGYTYGSPDFYVDLSNSSFLLHLESMSWNI